MNLCVARCDFFLKKYAINLCHGIESNPGRRPEVRASTSRGQGLSFWPIPYIEKMEWHKRGPW